MCVKVEQLMNQKHSAARDTEVDVVDLMQRMWLNRGFVLKVAVVCMMFGVGLALFSPVKYTAVCDFVPQTTGGVTMSQMSSLARLAGVDLQGGGDVEVLSPYVYENIMSSTKFHKELLQTKINLADENHPITLQAYFNRSWRGATAPDALSLQAAGTGIETLSLGEYRAIEQLAEALGFALDVKNGYMRISATMPEPLAAAQLAQAAMEQLQDYITEFKIAKLRSNLEFLKQRHDEVKRSFEQVQARRARHRDANRNVTNNLARIEGERIEAEYQLAMSIYRDMAMQLQQAQIRVKETMPMLAIINPVTLPRRRSSHARVKIVLVSLCVGLALGGCGVVVIPSLGNMMESERLRTLIRVNTKI